MTSPFEYYLIMQLDVIRNAIAVLLFVLFLPTAISNAVLAVHLADAKNGMVDAENVVAAVKPYAVTLAPLWLLLFVLHALLPTSDTAATLFLPHVEAKEIKQ